MPSLWWGSDPRKESRINVKTWDVERCNVEVERRRGEWRENSRGSWWFENIRLWFALVSKPFLFFSWIFYFCFIWFYLLHLERERERERHSQPNSSRLSPFGSLSECITKIFHLVWIFHKLLHYAMSAIKDKNRIFWSGAHFDKCPYTLKIGQSWAPRDWL